eukprot:3881206-Amphidinium_carterae.1
MYFRCQQLELISELEISSADSLGNGHWFSYSGHRVHDVGFNGQSTMLANSQAAVGRIGLLSPLNDQSSGDKLKTCPAIANTRAIDSNNFIPTNCCSDTSQIANTLVVLVHGCTIEAVPSQWNSGRLQGNAWRHCPQTSQ